MEQYINNYLQPSIMCNIYCYVGWYELQAYDNIPNIAWKQIYDGFNQDPKFKGQFDSYWNDDDIYFFNYKELLLLFINFLICDCETFDTMPDSLRKNKEFNIAAVKFNALFYIQDVDHVFYGDRQFAFAAVDSDERSFRYISDSLKSDKEIALTAVKYDGLMLQYVGNALKADKEVVLEATKQNYLAFQFAHSVLKSDRLTVLEALDCDYRILYYIDINLLKDREVISTAIKVSFGDGDIFNIIDPCFYGDREFMLEMVRYNDGIMDVVAPNLKQDKIFMMKLCKYSKLNWIFDRAKIR